MLAQANSEQDLLNQICDIIVRVGGYRMSGIAYAEHDEEKTIRPVAYAGHDNGYLEKLDLRWSDTPAGRGPSGTAIRENRNCVFGDLENDPSFEPWRQAALERGYKGVLCMPLRVSGTPFGVLAIYADHVGAFEASEVALLNEVANNLALGITAIRIAGRRQARYGGAARCRGKIPATRRAGTRDFVCCRGGRAGPVPVSQPAGVDDSRISSRRMHGRSAVLVESPQPRRPRGRATGRHVRGRKEHRSRRVPDASAGRP